MLMIGADINGYAAAATGGNSLSAVLFQGDVATIQL
jgi:hypothetical protein